ncbi:hypothetical protein SAMN05421821_10911 [Mucilaginibacter lappiensis]|uniref:Uncharacterized protein n=1 Tax=Mucilaginibacter lappiensis TaxID=354630 RepID=A0A1N7C6G9_9SPHI|nr:hypothetical protein [Mucilaginibacter lappiensis]MBB6127984.1 hypothetical protein [Mucilaginibacter lappiensis]SIR59185.1 hypothetical protein SAMN05421821_10911 [Mucilaginibacter lappiensis]
MCASIVDEEFSCRELLARGKHGFSFQLNYKAESFNHDLHEIRCANLAGAKEELCSEFYFASNSFKVVDVTGSLLIAVKIIE